MSRILIDSDVLIDFLRGREMAETTLSAIAAHHEALCSAITIGEVIAGMRSAEREPTYALLGSLTVIAVDFEVAELAGQWKSAQKSQQLQLDDCFIAATTHLHADYLLTHNKKHYPMSKIRFWDGENRESN